MLSLRSSNDEGRWEKSRLGIVGTRRDRGRDSQRGRTWTRGWFAGRARSRRGRCGAAGVACRRCGCSPTPPACPIRAPRSPPCRAACAASSCATMARRSAPHWGANSPPSARHGTWRWWWRAMGGSRAPWAPACICAAAAGRGCRLCRAGGDAGSPLGPRPGRAAAGAAGGCRGGLPLARLRDREPSGRAPARDRALGAGRARRGVSGPGAGWGHRRNGAGAAVATSAPERARSGRCCRPRHSVSQ